MPGPSKVVPDVKFHFVSVQIPDDGTVRRQARSHAVTRGIENKRKAEQTLGKNFRLISSQDETSRGKRRKGEPGIPKPLRSIPTSSYGAVEMLISASPKLQAWFRRYQLRQTYKPDFNVSDELVLQNFTPIIRKGVDDHALLSAMILTISYSIGGGSVDGHFLRSQNECMASIRQSMAIRDRSPAESTFGAILLLAGVEARIGMPLQVELHMGAIQELLSICQRRGVYLSDNLKRAIFWSDLNCSIMAGSNRVIDHFTFPELEWNRDSSSPHSYILPSGFQPYSHLLGDEFMEVIKDVSDLQCIRDSTILGRENVTSMANIDNQQASIQSRLVGLPNLSPLSECCHVAAYLCSTMLRCRIWRTSVLPSHLSSKLLYCLQETIKDATWDASADLLTWLILIGGSFSPAGLIRSGYLRLLGQNGKLRLDILESSWPELLEFLRQFIWSDQAFAAHVREFWRAIRMFPANNTSPSELL